MDSWERYLFEDRIKKVISLKRAIWREYVELRQDDDDLLVMLQCSMPDAIISIFALEIESLEYCFHSRRRDVNLLEIAGSLVDELDRVVDALRKQIILGDWRVDYRHVVTHSTDVVMAIVMLYGIREGIISQIAAKKNTAEATVSLININNHLSSYWQTLDQAITARNEINPAILECSYLLECFSANDF